MITSVEGFRSPHPVSDIDVEEAIRLDEFVAVFLSSERMDEITGAADAMHAVAQTVAIDDEGR
jgi:hypothetical protein